MPLRPIDVTESQPCGALSHHLLALWPWAGLNLSSVKTPVKPGRTVTAANTVVLTTRRALGQSYPRTLSFSPCYKVMNHFTDEETRALGGKVGDFPKVTHK